MVSLVSQPEMVQRLVNRLGEWNLKAARMMLEAGVDCVTFVDDLGSERGLLFSPDLYDRHFFPWHRALCDLAHAYGAARPYAQPRQYQPHPPTAGRDRH